MLLHQWVLPCSEPHLLIGPIQSYLRTQQRRKSKGDEFKHALAKQIPSQKLTEHAVGLFSGLAHILGKFTSARKNFSLAQSLLTFWLSLF